ncbi:hypothetical protein ACXYUI_26480, partial [Klebsiella pneumoniae]
MDEQVEGFLDGAVQLDAATTLTVLWIGANNYLGANPKETRVAAADITSAVERLIANGSNRFVLATLPDLSETLNHRPK